MVATQYPTQNTTARDLPVFGQETTLARHRSGIPARDLIDAAASRPSRPTVHAAPEPPVTVRAWLVDEQRKQHIGREQLRRDYADLLRKQHSDPMSVRQEQVESLGKQLAGATAVDVYLSQALAGMPDDNRDMAVRR